MKPDSVCRAAVIYGLEDVPSGVRAIVQDGIPPRMDISPLWLRQCRYPDPVCRSDKHNRDRSPDIQGKHRAARRPYPSGPLLQ